MCDKDPTCTEKKQESAKTFLKCCDVSDESKALETLYQQFKYENMPLIFNAKVSFKNAVKSDFSEPILKNRAPLKTICADFLYILAHVLF